MVLTGVFCAQAVFVEIYRGLSDLSLVVTLRIIGELLALLPCKNCLLDKLPFAFFFGIRVVEKRFPERAVNVHKVAPRCDIA